MGRQRNPKIFSLTHLRTFSFYNQLLIIILVCVLQDGVRSKVRLIVFNASPVNSQHATAHQTVRNVTLKSVSTLRTSLVPKNVRCVMAQSVQLEE